MSNPLTNVLDFGWTPQGSGGGSPTGTDYLGHDVILLSSLTHQFIDFGWVPQGTSGGGGGPPTLPHSTYFFADMGRMMGR